MRSNACEYQFSDILIHVYRKKGTVTQLYELCREYVGRENKKNASTCMHECSERYIAVI